MLNKFIFSRKQIDNYLKVAKRDFAIANKSDIPEVVFQFCYSCLVKTAISICAVNDLRIKSRQGHHIKLIEKLSAYLEDEEVNIIGNEMRSKRNFDLYGGGIVISLKSAKEYLLWIKNILIRTEKYINNKIKIQKLDI
ncbi:hypothetical protein K8R66_00560 [bacterium]|nr:hypothetical protein [bacterium]